MRIFLKNLKSNDGAKLAFFILTILMSSLVFFATPDLMPSALLSLLIYFLFSPLIDALERQGISRTSAALGFFLFGGLVTAAVATWGFPLASQEIQSFQSGTHTPSLLFARLAEMERRWTENAPYLKSLALTVRLEEWVSESSEKAWHWLSGTASQLMMTAFLVPFFSFVLLRDGHEIRRSLLRMVPNRYFEMIYSLSYRIFDKMGGYVSARIMESAAITALVSMGCWFFGIPYAIFIGLFVGATNPIPYLGPVIGAAPALLLALLEPSIPNQLMIVSALLLTANLIDMFLIFPFLVARVVDLHPVIVVVCVILGSKLFGIVGMIVGVPIASILKILVEEFYTKIYNQRAEAPLR